MTKNSYRVDKTQWQRWSAKARVVFNSVYAVMRDQGLFSHPKAKRRAHQHWKTTRWNAAWIAADAVDGRV